MKKTILMLMCAFTAFGQLPQRREFQEGNTTQLILFENSLPAKNYDLSTSDLQVKWHVLILDLLEQTTGYTPNVAARSLAYTNLAAYEAILPGYPNLLSLSGQLQGYKRPKEFDMDSSNFSAPLAMNAAMFRMVDKLFIAAPFVWMEKVMALKDSTESNLSKGKMPMTVLKSVNYGISVADMILKYSDSDGAKTEMFRSYDMNYRLPACESCFEINRVADLENTGPLHPSWDKNRTFLAENNSDFDIKPDFEFSKYKDSKFYASALEVITLQKKWFRVLKSI